MLLRTILTQALAILGVGIAVVFAGDLATTMKQPLNQFLVISALGLIAVSAVYDIAKAIQERPKRFRGAHRDAKIREYMTALISGQGRCVLSSKDLSWATGDAREGLLRKARERSLHLILPYESPISKELSDAGAEVHYYGNSPIALRSRFTIVNYSRADAWLAVGLSSPNGHTIREIRKNDDPAFHMAHDIAALAERLASSRSS